MELGEIMKSLGVANSPKELKTMFENLDVGTGVVFCFPFLNIPDKSQTINFNEFLGGLRWIQRVP